MPEHGAEFGIIVSTCGTSWDAKDSPSWDAIVNYAKRAEDLGFDSIWVMDHYWNPYQLDYYTFEALTALAALGSVVHHVRLGTCVICNPVRHPSNLATVIASLDTITNGRIDVGMGSGWGGKEAKMLGIEWPPYGTRVAMLEESIQVLGLLLSGERASFDGRYYNLDDARIGPSPVQRPHPPIWVGGTSESVQEIIAKFGDAWLPEAISPVVLKEGGSKIRSRAQQLGRNPDGIKIGWSGGALRGVISEDKRVVEKEAESIFKTNWWGKPVSEYFETVEELPWMIGTPDEIAGRIDRLVKAGCQMIATGFRDFPSTASLELYAEKVIPQFR
jgi:alkanesulfonate monooxygenase SsuD/methylene tetrahydromethanopterin reductase-like flavin-dependent oxidoreductase (luciferase family)